MVDIRIFFNIGKTTIKSHIPHYLHFHPQLVTLTR